MRTEHLSNEENQSPCHLIDHNFHTDQPWTKPRRGWQLTACASCKSNPSSVPWGIMDSYSHVGDGNSCRGYTLLRVTVTHAG